MIYTNTRSFGLALEKLRGDDTQKVFAEKIGVSGKDYNRAESGSGPTVPSTLLQKVATACFVEMSELTDLLCVKGEFSASELRFLADNAERLGCRITVSLAHELLRLR